MKREIKTGSETEAKEKEHDAGRARGRQTVRNWVRERMIARERDRENLA